MKGLRSLFLFGLLVAPVASQANGWPCWGQAAKRYGVPVTLLYSIARVESGVNAQATGGNKNGSHDIGLMQINSSWLPKLAKYGITERKLYADACLNLHVGAWILSDTIRTYGYNWRGLGAYNARSDKLRAVYAAKVVRELKKVRAMGYADAVTTHKGESAP